MYRVVSCRVQLCHACQHKPWRLKVGACDAISLLCELVPQRWWILKFQHTLLQACIAVLVRPSFARDLPLVAAPCIPSSWQRHVTSIRIPCVVVRAEGPPHRECHDGDHQWSSCARQRRKDRVRVQLPTCHQHRQRWPCAWLAAPLGAVPVGLCLPRAATRKADELGGEEREVRGRRCGCPEVRWPPVLLFDES